MSQQIKTLKDFRDSLKLGKFTSYGCYPLYFGTSDGDVLCADCAKEERHQVYEALRTNDKDCGFHVFAIDVNWEDPFLLCAHCNERIESAYAEDDAPKKVINV